MYFMEPLKGVDQCTIRAEPKVCRAIKVYEDQNRCMQVVAWLRKKIGAQLSS